MHDKKKTIGILGGMGPAASADLYFRIIKYSQKKYNAVQDYEYPPIFLVSLALAGFDETGITDENIVKEQLIDGVKKLESAGADFIVIACNSVHVFYEELQAAVKIPILNIVEETRKKVQELGYKKVGLFSSESTNKLGLYQSIFSKNNIEIVAANEAQQELLNAVIEDVMAGRQSQKDVEILKNIAADFIKNGAEAIVLGCTEIPLAINQSQIDIQLFDATQILAESAVDISVKDGK